MKFKYKKKYIYYFLIIAFAFTIVICGYNIYKYQKSASMNENEFNSLKSLVIDKVTDFSPPATVGTDEYIWGDPEPSNPTPIPEPTYNVTDDGNYVVAPPENPEPKETKKPTLKETYDFSGLKNMNSDFVGWLTIPGTKLDYPIMQTNRDPDYYLRKNFYGEYSVLGTPYAEEGCDIDKPSDNITIYGHHIKNGTMFGSLEKYEDKAFYEDHKHITFNTTKYDAKYEVIAVYKSVVYTGKPDEFKYWNFIDAEDEEHYNQFISKIKELSLYEIPETAVYGDKLISLSTCEYSEENGRLVIVAKMIEQTIKD